MLAFLAGMTYLIYTGFLSNIYTILYMLLLLQGRGFRGVCRDV